MCARNTQLLWTLWVLQYKRWDIKAFFPQPMNISIVLQLMMMFSGQNGASTLLILPHLSTSIVSSYSLGSFRCIRKTTTTTTTTTTQRYIETTTPSYRICPPGFERNSLGACVGKFIARWKTFLYFALLKWTFLLLLSYRFSFNYLFMLSGHLSNL